MQIKYSINFVVFDVAFYGASYSIGATNFKECPPEQCTSGNINCEDTYSWSLPDGARLNAIEWTILHEKKIEDKACGGVWFAKDFDFLYRDEEFNDIVLSEMIEKFKMYKVK